MKIFLFCFYKIWFEPMFLTGSFAVLIRAAHFDFAQYKPPPFRIFAGLRLAEVASATQAGGFPRPALFAKRAGRNAFELIQEYCTSTERARLGLTLRSASQPRQGRVSGLNGRATRLFILLDL